MSKLRKIVSLTLCVALVLSLSISLGSPLKAFATGASLGEFHHSVENNVYKHEVIFGSVSKRNANIETQGLSTADNIKALFIELGISEDVYDVRAEKFQHLFINAESISSTEMYIKTDKSGNQTILSKEDCLSEVDELQRQENITTPSSNETLVSP